MRGLRVFVLLVALVTLVAGCGPLQGGASDQAKEEAAIGALVGQLVSALKAKDASAVEGLGYSKPNSTKWLSFTQALAILTAVDAETPVVTVSPPYAAGSVSLKWDFTVDLAGTPFPCVGVPDQFSVQKIGGAWKLNLSELYFAE